MTNVKMLESVYSMLETVLNFISSDEKNSIKEMLLSEDNDFGKIIKTLEEDIAQESAKKNGVSTQRNALKRIIKVASHDDRLNGIWTNKEGNQVVCNGYVAIHLKTHFDLPKVKGLDTDAFFNFNRIKLNKTVPLPTIGKLKNIIAKHKQDTKKDKVKSYATYDFGDNLPRVNVQYLLDIMEVLPDVLTVSLSSQNSPVYFESKKYGKAVLMPCRKK